MKVVVLHQGDPERDNALVRNAVATAQALVSALGHVGAEAIPVFLDGQLRFIRTITDEAPDIVLNACDLGLAYDSTLEPHVAAILDTMRVPYTGSGYLALALTDDKFLCHQLLSSAGVPCPNALALRAGVRPTALDISPPIICKPLTNHNSIDVDFASVVHDERSLERKVDEIARGSKDFLIEQYIDGREVIGAFLGHGDHLQLLPFEEIEFGAFFQGKPKILTFDSKWATSSRASLESTVIIPAPLSARLEAKLSSALVAVARAFCIHDYGRVDFRIDADERIYVIDVNANPDIGPGAGLAKMALAHGLDYPGMIDAIVHSAVARARS